MPMPVSITASSDERPLSGAPAAWAASAAEAELRGDVREGGADSRLVAVARVPGEHHVHILHEAGARHVDLAAAAFLGGRAVEADGAGELASHEFILRRDGRRDGRGAEKVVAAAVAGIAFHPRLLLRACRTGRGRAGRRTRP